MSETPSRPIERHYRDPLEVVWVGAAEQLGFRIVRSDEVFASWDGERTLTLGRAETLDPDDSPAQMILHELCHALVEGPEGRARPDWGLDNVDDRDAVREHACHRLQAALADRWGLRAFMAPTTDWRPYYEALPAAPLAPGDDPAIPPARQGWERAQQPPWHEILEGALCATAAIAAAVAPYAPESCLWAATDRARRVRRRRAPAASARGDGGSPR